MDIASGVIDSLKFAAAEDCVRGRIGLERLQRLAELLQRREGSLRCEVSGFREADAAGVRLGLQLRVEGVLTLQCQRCLGEVEFECRIDNRFLLLPPGEEWPEDELSADDYDVIPASREMSLATLIEDEVLLALPLVPRHADCRGPAFAAGDEQDRQPSPFAALAGLRKH